MAEDKNLFTDKTLDNQLFSVLEGLSNAGTYVTPTRDCFNDLTIDGQLYQILLAVEAISGGGGLPALHNFTHFTGGTDPIAPSDIGAVAETRTVTAGTGLTGGGDLSANRTIQALFGTTAGTICEGNDPRLSGGGGGITSINGDTTAAQTIAGTAPIGVASAGGTTTISSTQAGAATDGYLSSTDWNTFDNKVNRSGDTMTGKLNLQPSTTTEAGLNIGNGVTSATNEHGDIWMIGNTLRYYGTARRDVAVTNASNTFASGQVVNGSSADAALRITQTGTGEALRVEDETTPDATAFVISNAGKVGIGVTPDASVCLSLDSTGVKFNDGSVQTTADLPAIRGQVSRMTSGTITIGTAGTYQSTGLTATLDATTAAGMSLGTTDTFAVKNTTSATRILKIYASMDASANNNEQLGIKMAKNGTEINETECRANTGSHNFAKLVTNWMISMAPNDEVALFVANHSSTNTITLQRGRVTASFVD